MTIERNDVIAEIKSWLDVPWQHQARIKKNDNFAGAVDCVGLVACVNNKFSNKCIDYTNYKRKPSGDNLLYIFKERMQEIEEKNAKNGDVVVLSVGRDPHHVGFLIDDKYIIHACADAGKVTIELFDDRLKRRARGYFMFEWLV